MRYALKIAYDGTNYSGWQVQNNASTVQQVIEEKIFELTGKKTAVVASGRTDAGVHARGQVCHADVDTTIPPEKFADALNVKLPYDIRVMQSAKAYDGFDANRSAKKKTYVYKTYFSKRQNPLLDRYAVWVKCERPDVEKLNAAAKEFEGEHDFKAYCASRSQVKTTIRTVYSVKVESISVGEEILVNFYVCGNGFLYNMVRTMVGTMLFCSLGRLSLENVKTSLSECDRTIVGKTMPPNGLTLLDVDYGVKIF